MTKQQLFNRIRHRMADYVSRNRGPIGRPRGTTGVALPISVELKEIDNHTPSTESFVVNLHTMRQILTQNEQEIVKYRLMGYTVEDIARQVGMAAKTVEGYLTSISKACREVTNV